MSALIDQLESNREAGGGMAGVASATVTANDDPLGLGRVKLNFAWREPGFTTDWTRCVAPMAGGGRGACFVPEVGDEVLVAFDRDDVCKPYVLGGLWSDKDKPPEGYDKQKNDRRIIRSRKGHMLQFDDGSKGIITIQLNDGKKKVEIDDDGIRVTDGGNSITIDTKSGAVTIEAATSLSLKAPKIAIEASGSLDLKGGATLNAQAGMVKIN